MKISFRGNHSGSSAARATRRIRRNRLAGFAGRLGWSLRVGIGSPLSLTFFYACKALSSFSQSSTALLAFSTLSGADKPF